MELKYINSINEIILVSKVNYVRLFFGNIKIEFKNESYDLFSQANAMIVYKPKSSITFTSLIQMESLKKN